MSRSKKSGAELVWCWSIAAGNEFGEGLGRESFPAVSRRRVLYGRSWSLKIVRTSDEISVVGSVLAMSFDMVMGL